MFRRPLFHAGWQVALALAALATGATAAGAQEWQRAVPFTEHPPKIDGRLEPGEWRHAVTIDDFQQVEPTVGAEPSEHTVLHLMVDEDYLYIGLDCRDSDRDGILGTQITRDANLDPDDRVELLLDTFLDRRNAYWFQIGPGGSKGDALIAGNGSFFSKDWDGIWEGRARVSEEGWSAELAIPAKTLSLQPGLDSWGFNARRFIKRKNEEAQWASPDRRTRFFNVASAGTLTGMGVLHQGAGLDVVPYLSLKGNRDHLEEDNGSKLEPGLDLRYRLTPSLTSTFTVNTDFAETEVDNRVVNLSRFPVFFPEKRDFFLEDSGIFSFGPFGGRGRNDMIPFFSRRIGLSEGGEPVPLLAGGKLTGRTGRVNLGLLDVVADEFGTLSTKNLAAGRASLNLLEESQLGAIFTYGDPATNGDNALGGLDFTYRTRRFRGGDTLRLDTWVLATADEPETAPGQPAVRETGHAFGFLAQYPNDFIEAELGWQEISEDFRPDLGFVRRRGVRQLTGNLEVRPRPARGPVRRFTFGLRPERFTSLADGEVETASYRFTPIEILFHSGDQIGLAFTPTEERLTEPFEIFDGIVLLPGRYRFDRWEVEVESSDKRKVAGRAEVSGGTFFSGRRDEVELGAFLRPMPGVTVEVDYSFNDVRLGEGDFITNLAQLRLTVDFTPDISWITLAQWDDVTDSIGVNSRLRWILEPGRDLFFVLNQGYGEEDRGRSGFSPVTTDSTFKVNYTLRF